jgi:hypothetical protein
MVASARVGMVLKHNELWKGGAHEAYRFARVERVTDKGIVMVLPLERMVGWRKEEEVTQTTERRVFVGMPCASRPVRLTPRIDMWTEVTDDEMRNGVKEESVSR